MAHLRFGEKKKSRFPYWVIPTVIFVFGVGMLTGRGMESGLTLAEFRDQKLTVSDLLDRLWPKRAASVTAPSETVAERTALENRLKHENARLLTEKDALVEQLQTLKSDLSSREESIEQLRNEVNELAQANQELLDLRKEYEKFKQEVAVEREERREREAAGRRAARIARREATPRPAAENRVLAREKREPAVVQSTERSRGPSYQVLRRTPILRNPSENAQILYYLNPGRRVNVGGIVNGRFVRVQYSRSGNPPGYVLVTDVMPLEP